MSIHCVLLFLNEILNLHSMDLFLNVLYYLETIHTTDHMEQPLGHIRGSQPILSDVRASTLVPNCSHFPTVPKLERSIHQAAAPDIENIYIKHVLGVSNEPSNVAVLGELGRMSMNIFRQERIIRYSFKLINSSRMINRSYICNKVSDFYDSFVGVKQGEP
jgi:hypothetical protein